MCIRDRGSTPDGGVSGCYSYRPAPARVGRTGVPSPCRVPPRRAGNFLLLAQKKVTKEECLRQTPLSSFGALRTPGPAGDLTARGRSPQQPARTLRARCASPLAFGGRGMRLQTRCAALASSFSGSAGQRVSGAAVQRSYRGVVGLWSVEVIESSSQRALPPRRPPGDAKRAVAYERAGGGMCRSASGHPLGRACGARRTS